MSKRKHAIVKSGRVLRLGRAHKDYIIGQHWLSSAYERICAGENEQEVMKDYGYRAALRRRK